MEGKTARFWFSSNELCQMFLANKNFPDCCRVCIHFWAVHIVFHQFSLVIYELTRNSALLCECSRRYQVYEYFHSIVCLDYFLSLSIVTYS